MENTISTFSSCMDFLKSNADQIKLISGLIAIPVASLSTLNLIINIQKGIREKRLQKLLRENEGSSSFTATEIHDALKNYVIPDCSVTDPSNEVDLINVADVREVVFDVVIRFIRRGGDKRHILLLADSGMGKTTFCLNFYARLHHLLGKSSDLKGAIVSAGRPGAEHSIKQISNPKNTILLLDAFDEDQEAVDDSKQRLIKLMNTAADFAAVIVTCRSQFFDNDAAVPDETGISIIHPRRAGESSSYKFHRLYLMPFNGAQIEKYIKGHFPLINPLKLSSRKAARRLISEIPELSVRPMLLALIPDLAKEKRKPKQLFELYNFMFEQWLERESRWISKDKLREVSQKVSVYMLNQGNNSVKDRITVEELDLISSQISENKEDWKHLKARSLLNRDSRGLFKFSHRSVMEFLYVKTAIEGEKSCFSRKWTDFMRDLIISWGQSDLSPEAAERADEILNSDLRLTEILPLQSALPQARQIPLFDFEKRFAKYRNQSSNLVQIPASWRKHSLRLSMTGGVSRIYDFCYDLIWEIVHTQSNEEYNIFRHKLPEYIKKSQSKYRLPSIEQFISLVEAESQFPNIEILDKNEKYWIGDITSKSRPIFATFFPYKAEKSIRKIMEFHKNASLPCDLYFYDFDQNSKEGAELSAMIPGVISGEAEKSWYSSPLTQVKIGPTKRVRSKKIN